MTGFGFDGGEFERVASEMRALPARLEDEVARGALELAEATAADARKRAQAEHPVALTRKHEGDYHWGDLVRTIEADTDGRVPFVAYGSSKTPGWASWDKGSTERPQFGPRRTGGKFFGPAIDDARDKVDETGALILARATKDLEGLQ